MTEFSLRFPSKYVEIWKNDNPTHSICTLLRFGEKNLKVNTLGIHKTTVPH